MSMRINGSSRMETVYAKHLKEEQPAERTEKEAANDFKESDKKSVLHDEYISSEKSDAKPSGLYRLGKDESGSPRVFYDRLDKSGNLKQQSDVEEDGTKEEKGAAQHKPVSKQPEESEEMCTADTGRADREIRMLKEKKQQLEQQLGKASEDETKVRELEKKLAQIENELNLKDNDAYRRQHTDFSER